MVDPMGTQRQPKRNSKSPQSDPRSMMRYLRSIDNTVLWGGICAIVSLFFLNTLFALAGIAFNWIALARLSRIGGLFDVPNDLLERKRRTARIVMVLCLVTVILDVILGNVLASIVEPYLSESSDVASSLMGSLSGETSTWG